MLSSKGVAVPNAVTIGKTYGHIDHDRGVRVQKRINIGELSDDDQTNFRAISVGYYPACSAAINANSV